MSLAVIRRDGRHAGVLSSFDPELAEVIKALLEKHDSEYTVEIKASPGEDKKGS